MHFMNIRDFPWSPVLLLRKISGRTVVFQQERGNDNESLRALDPASFGSGSIDSLVSRVYEIVGPPVAGYAITALLESRGWTDHDAQAYFGVPNLAKLGEMVWERFWGNDHLMIDYRGGSLIPASSTPLHGFYFLLLALLQLLGLGVAGVALGVGYGLSSSQMFSVGIGLVFGLVWANGFAQLLARDPLSVHLEGDDAVAGLLGMRLVGIAAFTLLALGGLIAAGALLMAPDMFRFVMWGIGFCFAIALFWIFVNVLFIFDLAPWTLVATLLTFIVMAWGFRRGICQNSPMMCPLAGIFFADFVLFSIVLGWFLNVKRVSALQELPSWRLTLVDQSGYLFYGFGVMILVVVDRLVAWWVSYSMAIQPTIAYYEVGLGWSLLTFLVIIAIQERLLRNLLDQLQQWSQLHTLKGIRTFTKQFQRAYWKKFGFIMLVAILAAGGLLLVLGYLRMSSVDLHVILPRAEGWLVFRWSLLGYSLLAVAMMNLGLLIIVGQPAKTLMLLAIAVIIDVSVAWLSAVSIGYSASVIGLVAASGILLFLSSLQIHKLLRSAAYLFFSSG